MAIQLKKIELILITYNSVYTHRVKYLHGNTIFHRGVEKNIN